MEAPYRRASRRRLHVWVVVAALVLTACDHYAAAADAGLAATPQLTPTAPVPGVGGCSDVGTSDPGAVVDLLHREDGCVPASEAVVARCDPTSDPLALLDLAGAPRRYLGGRFAVPAADLPLGASVVGVSVVGRVWLTPGDPPGLYVESSAGVERWLPLPTPRSLDRPASVTMIGDSILEGADPVMAELLGSDWTVSLDAVVGRDAAGAAAVAEALPDPTADAVVVEIGVNDHDAGVFAAGQDRILAAVADADLVLWVNAHGPDVAVPAINEALTAGMAAWPVGAVADWDRWVPEASLSSDGVHPDTGNAALLADLVVPLLSSWRQAVWGGGPARCVDEVTAAVVG